MTGRHDQIHQVHARQPEDDMTTNTLISLPFLRPLAVAAVLGSAPLTAWGQSVISLESFNIVPEAEVDEGTEAEPSSNCLINPDHPNCDTTPSGRTFSLSDVVNLGIIDRSEVEAEETNQGGEQVEVEARVDPLPSIDLEILFDYASSDLRPDQLPPLIALLDDLEEIDFTRARLVLMGHTDGVGSAAYNRDLSQRRADSVANFLSGTAGIPRSRIRTSGMGFDYLLYPNDPSHPGNRRVQILLVD